MCDSDMLCYGVVGWLVGRLDRLVRSCCTRLFVCLRPRQLAVVDVANVLWGSVRLSSVVLLHWMCNYRAQMNANNHDFKRNYIHLHILKAYRDICIGFQRLFYVYGIAIKTLSTCQQNETWTHTECDDMLYRYTETIYVIIVFVKRNINSCVT